MVIPLISADEARQAREAFDAGRPWVKIVEGDRLYSNGLQQRQFDAPSRWADLDKSCETCGGTARMPGRDDADGVTIGVCPNPDCRDGRQVWELRTATAGWGHDAIGHGLDPGVLVARVTVQVVPVVTGDDSFPDATHVTIDALGSVILWVWDGQDFDPVLDLPLDPLPVPGRDFGVVFKEARSG